MKKFVNILFFKLKYIRNYLSGFALFWVLMGWLMGFSSLPVGTVVGSFFIIVLIYYNSKKSFYKVFLACLLGFLIGLGQGSYIAINAEKKKDLVSGYINKDVEIVAKVEEEPRQIPTGIRYDVKILSLGADNVSDDFGSLELRLPVWPEYEYGDILSIRATPKLPKNKEDSDFDYVSYLERDNKFLVVRNAKVEKVGESKSIKDRLIRSTYSVKKTTTKSFQRNLHEPHAALLAGILLGVQSTLPLDFAEQLRVTGTTHIVAVSGYNMTIIVEFINKFGKFLGRSIKAIFSAILIIWFGIMTGMSPPVLRAVISALMTLISTKIGANTDSFGSTVVVALLMLIYDPNLFYSISFLLSFGAVLGLIFWVPVLKRIFPFVPSSIEEGTLVTLSATLMTSPIMAYYFSSFSVISLVSNFLVAPLVGIIMLLGFVAILADLLIPFQKLVFLFYIFVWPFLDLFQQIVQFTAKVDFLYFDWKDSFELGSSTILFIYLMQTFFIFLIFPFRKKDIPRFL